jgi:phosphoglucomutase
VKEVATTPYEGQKTGTSGLRKKTREFTKPNYLANWVQSLFNALGDEVKGQTLGLGGDGRYYGKEAAQTIIKLAAGNGFAKVVVGRDALMATPAMSAVIRRNKLYGGWAAAGGAAWGGWDDFFGRDEGAGGGVAHIVLCANCAVTVLVHVSGSGSEWFRPTILVGPLRNRC